MRLVSVRVTNFRCYKSTTTADFCDLTAFVGKNDIGKSTILEALEIFFNNDTVKIDHGDKNIHSDEENMSIECEFSDLPTELSLDAGATTDLKSEFLVTKQETLKIKKVYDCSLKKLSYEVFITALHPTAEEYCSLLEHKEKDLQALVTSKGLKVPLKGNPGMRKALWASADDLKLEEVEINISKGKEDKKRIWDALEKNLPLYALFQSDRKSQDSDEEVQNPMKVAITAALAEVQQEIEVIQDKVRKKALEIANETHAALMQIDSHLAAQLSPDFMPPASSKWSGLFNINLETDGIPLNKRGSGVRRLVLVAFFKAEAERKLHSEGARQIIYALEEPETSQHPKNQKVLLDALKNISQTDGCQVILTTHSPGLAAELPADSIRFIYKDENHTVQIRSGAGIFDSVASALGVTPDSRVKVLFCVEGPTDVHAFKALSKALHQADPTIPDLSTDGRVAFVVMGGSTLNQWVSQNYLQGLGRREFHIYDRDVAAYEIAEATVNGRNDGSMASRTAKHEIECYLHPDAILQAYGVTCNVTDVPVTPDETVGKTFGRAYSIHKGWDQPMGETKAKIYLANRAFPAMTAQMIDHRDPHGEVRGWFRSLSQMLET